MFFKGPEISKLEIPAGMDPDLIKKLSKKEFNVFVLKFILALIALIFGIILIWIGVESDSIIKFQYKDAIIELNKAYPGITLALVGLLLMFFSRMNIKIK